MADIRVGDVVDDLRDVLDVEHIGACGHSLHAMAHQQSLEAVKTSLHSRQATKSIVFQYDGHYRGKCRRLVVRKPLVSTKPAVH
jgi:hypothetical protein